MVVIVVVVVIVVIVVVQVKECLWVFVVTTLTI